MLPLRMIFRQAHNIVKIQAVKITSISTSSSAASFCAVPRRGENDIRHGPRPGADDGFQPVFELCLPVL